MRRVFIDMDGVLCSNSADDTVEDMERTGYFRGLAPRVEMVEAVKYLLRDENTAVYILSAVLPDTAEAATHEKNEWLDEYLPEIDRGHRIFTLCGMSKADAVGGVAATDVLCDDFSHNLTGWVDAGGIGVKILNGINGKSGTFTAGPRIRITRRDDLSNALAAMWRTRAA